MTIERIIYGGREDIRTDERFPDWCFKSNYAEQIYRKWEENISFRADCEQAQREPMFRKYIIRQIEKEMNR